MTNRWGKSGNSDRLYFLGLQNQYGQRLQQRNEKTLAPWNKSCDKPKQHIKKQRHHFAHQCLSSQSYGFSSSHIWMWELNCKEGWVLKNWCFQTVVLEKSLKSPLDFKEIKMINPKGKQTWILIERTEHGAEVPVLWSRIKGPTYWKKSWCWERLKVKEWGHRGWDG